MLSHINQAQLRKNLLNSISNIENEKITVAENSYCLIEGQITCPASIMDKARIGKAIQEVTGAKPVVFLRGFYEEGNDVAHIYKSFNINDFYMWWKGFLNPTIFIPCLIRNIKNSYFI
jgi:hypothetical protein